MMRGGSVVDATLISAPVSTKNAEKKRDPEMHQVKKGNAWHFGMSCHIGIDAGSGLVHSLVTTPANVHDITVASKLIREDDTVLYGDSGYLGIQKREDILCSPHTSQIDYRINLRPSSIQKVPQSMFNWEKHIETQKSSACRKVEHPFLIVKRYFGIAKQLTETLQKGRKVAKRRVFKAILLIFIQF